MFYYNSADILFITALKVLLQGHSMVSAAYHPLYPYPFLFSNRFISKLQSITFSHLFLLVLLPISLIYNPFYNLMHTQQLFMVLNSSYTLTLTALQVLLQGHSMASLAYLFYFHSSFFLKLFISEVYNITVSHLFPLVLLLVSIIQRN